MTGYIVHDLSMLGLLLVFCEHDTHSSNRQEALVGIMICLQASYETLYHSYLSTNKAESLGSGGDTTQEVMQAILQAETSKRACAIM